MPQFNLCYVLRFQANGIAVAVTRKNKTQQPQVSANATNTWEEWNERQTSRSGVKKKKTPNQRKEKIICLITNWRTFVSKHIYIRWILWVVPLSTACSHIGHNCLQSKYTHIIYTLDSKRKSVHKLAHLTMWRRRRRRRQNSLLFLLSLKWLFFFYCRDCLYSFVFWILLFTILSLFEFNQMRIMWRKKLNEKNEH